MKTRKPKIGAEVIYVMEKGNRVATVSGVWSRPHDIDILATRYGMSVEDIINSHRLRASLKIQMAPEDGLPNPFYVINVEYDASGREGSWHYKP